MPVSSLSSRSRLVALVATPALALGALAAVPAPSYAADPAPAADGAAWLAGELTDGLIFNEQFEFDDLGLSIDTGLALLAVEGQPDAVAAVRTALEENIDGYVTGEAFGDVGSQYAGATAKAAAFATAVGADPSAFGGRDLVADLESVASDDAAIRGRLQDVSGFGDFANTIGQSFAVRALTAAGSAEAGDVTSFLLAQQCDEGFFRLSFAAPSAANQTCDGDPSSSASTDVTGLALLNLLALDEVSPAAERATADAVAWLLETQGADGSWGSDEQITDPNANSTGLASWALTEVDSPVLAAAAVAAAASGAAYLRGLQAEQVAPCTTGLSDESGAIAYDAAALETARADGITVEAQDQFRRATAQALPALLVAPEGTYSSEPTSSSDFVQARTTQQIRVDSLAPGQTVCFARGTSTTVANADADGTAVGTVRIPRGSTTRTFAVSLSDRSYGSVSFRALDATRFKVSVKRAKVPANRKQRVVVRGLTKGESLTIRYEGRVIKRAVAQKRRYATRFDVTRTKGKQRVQVIGEFGNRRGTEKFRVVKAR